MMQGSESPTRRVWAFQASTGLSAIGEAVNEVVIPLVAIIWLHQDPLFVGVLVAAEQAPWLIVGIPAGALVERLDFRRVLAASLTVRAVLVGLVAILLACNAMTPALLLVFAALLGTANIFSTVVRQSMLSRLVTPDKLIDASGRLNTIDLSSDFTGRSVSGVLAQSLGNAWALAIDAALCAVSAGFANRTRPASAISSPNAGFWYEALDGAKYSLRNRTLRTYMSIAIASNIAVSAEYAVATIYLVNVLEVGTSLVGIFLATASIGGIAGASMASKLSRRFGAKPVLSVASFVAAAGATGLAFASHGWNLWLYVAGAFLNAGGLAISSIIWFAARQQSCAQQYQARVAALTQAVTWALIPAGGILGGWIGDVLGVRSVLLFVAAVLTMIAVYTTSIPSSLVSVVREQADDTSERS